jgi:glutamate/tyrosine decarboxylase-like PLP-dependent enzyme
MTDRIFERVASYSADFLSALGKRRVAPTATVDELRSAFGGPLPDRGTDSATIIDELIEAAEPGLMATCGPRFFGFVIGGSLPEAVAAEWLASTWDQNAGLYVAAPAATVAEEVAGNWLLELLGLPETCSFGFVTGGQMANFTGLAAARHHVLAQEGWDVNAQGVQGAPRVRILASEERHATIDRALRYLGLGTDSLQPIEVDDQARMRPDALQRALEERTGPTIVTIEAGNINSGAFDRFNEVCDLAHAARAWVHVDGAVGLWAAASAECRHLVEGLERADSWATDAHKWLNVPYDSGLVFCAHPESHKAAMSVHADYLIHAADDRERDPMDWNPEFSRRARGFGVYAALRAMGRTGVAEMIDRCRSHALLFAERLGAEAGIEILNEIQINQVLVRFVAENGDHDDRTRRVIKAVQEDGTCWLSGSRWKGSHVMRISISNWSTSTEDVELSVKAILGAAAANP